MEKQKFEAVLTLLVPQVIRLILNQYTPFLARVEGLENIAVVEQEDTKVWHLSPLTLFNMFDEEKKTGAFTFPEEV